VESYAIDGSVEHASAAAECARSSLPFFRSAMAAPFSEWSRGYFATRCSRRTTTESVLPFLLHRARIHDSLTNEPVQFGQLFGQPGAFAFSPLHVPARRCICITLNAPRLYRALLLIWAIYSEIQRPLGCGQWRDGAFRNLKCAWPVFSVRGAVTNRFDQVIGQTKHELS
jgi:hypothetical protein